LVFFLSCIAAVVSYEVCTDETGSRGICPASNTCCFQDGSFAGCIAADLGERNATCCNDGVTGCPVGYHCRQNHEKSDCIASDTNKNPHTDPLTKKLPRYQLCQADEIVTVYSMPVDSSSSSADGAEIPYYSNLGNIDTINASSVEMVLIVVHGANRNGDDYFCSSKATISLQEKFSNILIIAPNFYSVGDDRPKESFLYWGSEEDTDGSWRYGAHSSGPTQHSSYSVMDQLVSSVLRRSPNIKLLTVAGHSSGGQLVQRWSLLTSVWKSQYNSIVQAVVANPSSYIYLSPHRYIDGGWKVPNDKSCMLWNSWEWGLNGSGKYNVPYRDHALSKNKTSVVLDRYKDRRVIYLIGGLDRCNVSEVNTGWCFSHGLETKCMDNLQGLNRFERHERYISSLRRLGYSSKYHIDVQVEGVGHDHSMMFQSSQGINAIYYRDENSWDFLEQDSVPLEE
jgi:pimeloyl-ACP methyl ester carboxylesterase